MSESPDKRKRGWGAWVAALVLLVLYISAYLETGAYSRFQGSYGMVTINRRNFDSAILQKGFCPIGWLESRIRGEYVVLTADPEPLCYTGDAYYSPSLRAEP